MMSLHFFLELKKHKLSLLHMAVKSKDPNYVKLLVKLGCNVKTQITDCKTPLHSSVFDGNYEITNLLIENGANVNAVTNSGWSPLQIAVQENLTEIAKLLIFL